MFTYVSNLIFHSFEDIFRALKTIILRALIHPDFPIITEESKKLTTPLRIDDVGHSSTLLSAK